MLPSYSSRCDRVTASSLDINAQLQAQTKVATSLSRRTPPAAYKSTMCSARSLLVISPECSNNGGTPSQPEMESLQSEIDDSPFQRQRIVPRMGTRAVAGVDKSKTNGVGKATRRTTGNRSTVVETTPVPSWPIGASSDDSASTNSGHSDRCRLLQDDTEKPTGLNDVRSNSCYAYNKMADAQARGGSSTSSLSSGSCSSISEQHPLVDREEEPTAMTTTSPHAVISLHRKLIGERKQFLARPETAPPPFDLAVDKDVDSGNSRLVSNPSKDSRRLSTTMVTNRAHLAHTIMIQQKLFQQQLMAVQRHHNHNHHQQQQPLASDQTKPRDADRTAWTSDMFDQQYEHQYEEIGDRTPPTPPPVPPVNVHRPPLTTAAAVDNVIRCGVSPNAICASEGARCSADARCDRGRTSPRQPSSRPSNRLQQVGTDVAQWVVKKRPDGTRHIARRSKKQPPTSSPTANDGGEVAAVVAEGPEYEDTSRDTESWRQRQLPIDSTTRSKPTTFDSTLCRHREMRVAAIMDLFPAVATESRPPAVYAVDLPSNMKDDDVTVQMAKSNQALLSVTTM